MINRAPIAAERLSAEELAALDLREQAMALNEILHHVGIVGRELRRARNGLSEAKKALLLCAESSQKDALKAAVIDAQLIVQHLLDRARMLRECKSILQTLMRSGSP